MKMDMFCVFSFTLVLLMWSFEYSFFVSAGNGLGPTWGYSMLGVICMKMISRLLLGGSSHTKDVKNGSGPSLHGIHDDVTGWVSMWAYDMLSQ